MKHKAWKAGFVVALLGTVFWTLGTIGGAILWWNDPIFLGRQAAVFCLILGVATIPWLLLVNTYLAWRAFRDVKERG